MKRGQLPLPDAIKNAPTLLPGLELYWIAYSELSTCRQAGFTEVGSIPWTAIDRYSERHGFSPEQHYLLVAACRAMDEEMREWNRKKDGS